MEIQICGKVMEIVLADETYVVWTVKYEVIVYKSGEIGRMDA